MFVRFRETERRLQVSLVETRRRGGRVRHEHVAGLGSVEAPLPSVRARVAFWEALHGRLARLSNRIDPTLQAKILGEVHVRIPMVTMDEMQAAKIESAETDQRWWSSLQGMHQDNAAGQKQLAAKAQQAAATGEASAAEAAGKAAAAKDRAERLRRGEDVPGGLGKPRTHDDAIDILRRAGWTNGDLERMRLLTILSEAEIHNELVPEMLKAKDAVEKRVTRAFVRRRSIKLMPEAWHQGVVARRHGVEQMPEEFQEPTREAEAIAWLLGWKGKKLPTDPVE